MSRESRKLLTQVIRTLSDFPPMEMIRILNELREADAFTVLATLRSRAEHFFGSEEPGRRVRPTAGVNVDQALDSAELELYNPVAYPPLSSLEPNLLENKSYQELIQSSASGSTSSQ